MAENSLTAALLAVAQASQEKSPDHRSPVVEKVDDRYGVPEQTEPTIGKATPPESEQISEDESHSDEDVARADRVNIQEMQLPPPYGALGLSAECSDLEENPLWRSVQSDMERDHGRFYHWILRDRSSEEARAVDPVRRGRYMGLKLITTLYFPLTNDIFRFFWSLLQLVIMCTLTALGFIFIVDSSVCDDYNNKKLCKYNEVAAVCVIVVAFILSVADFVTCTMHLASKRFWHMCCRSSPEAQPLLGGPRSSKCRAIAGWWVKYSDIPRFVLSEALFIAIFYLGLIGFINDLIAISQFLLMTIIQFVVLISVLHYCTCTRKNFGVSYRDAWLLLGFILTIAMQKFYLCLLLFFVLFASFDDSIHVNSSADALVIVSVMLVASYLVPLLGTLTFFIIVYGWLKYVLIKTFKGFLDYLSQHGFNSSNQQERQQIQNVLDSYQYEALSSSPLLHSKFRASLPRPVQTTLLGVLLILLLGSLSFVLSRIFDREYVTINPIWFPRIIGLTALFHIHYIITAIVWPYYIAVSFARIATSFCIRTYRSCT